MQGMVRLISDQEGAVSGINHAVDGLCELSRGSLDQTASLHALSGELNSAATGLNQVVERFRLKPTSSGLTLRRTR